MNEEIRSLYAELQGYLSQVPENTPGDDKIFDATLWHQVNFVIDEFIKLSGKDFSRFKIKPELWRVTNNASGREYISYSTYKAVLAALIAKIHAEYFASTEEPPFKTMPHTIINQTQTQSQSISLLLEIQEKVISEIPNHKEGTKERKFLEKVKDSLPTVKTGTDIISSLLKIASTLGLDSGQIHSLLNL